MQPVSVGGKPYFAVKQGFNYGTKDAFYGTGQHQNNQMNLNGEDVDLLQHNMDIAIPLVVSDRNYGILWDNNGITRFGDARPYGPIGRDLKLTDAAGKEGALTARYYIGGKLALERREDNINYQYLKDVAEFWPKELKPLKELKDVKVVWEGKLASDKPGVHKMKLYSSDYATLTVDGKQVMDVWRQGWNPWYHNFEVSFGAGKPVDFKLEWKPEGGMIYVAHNNPLPKPERHSLQFSSEIAESLNYYVIRGTSIDNVIGVLHVGGNVWRFLFESEFAPGEVQVRLSPREDGRHLRRIRKHELRLHFGAVEQPGGEHAIVDDRPQSGRQALAVERTRAQAAAAV